MNKIPVHKTAEAFGSFNAFIRRMKGRTSHSEAEETDMHHAHIKYAHRDEYYNFILVERGCGEVYIDFEEYEFSDNTIHCIMPGQVHQPTNDTEVYGWFLAVDSLFVKSEYREIIQRRALAKTQTRLSQQDKDELKACLMLIEKRWKRIGQPIERSVVSELISAYIGMIADIYRREVSKSLNNRAAEITLRFRSLLSENYRSVKSPAQYAGMMNLSPVYLNEVVKKGTGVSVRTSIRDEIVLQAKRLLFYTNLTVKDVALTLGYEDWAYFTRLFTKATGRSPSQFRQENLE